MDRGPGKIQRANLDGSNVEDLITRGLEEPSGIALDVAGGKMYWTDWDTGKIQRANLDGTEIRDIITGLDNPSGIALGIPSQTAPSTPDLVVEADVNGDGVVNVQDLVLVAGNLGKTGENVADVNNDGVVNVQDLVLVAGNLGGAAAAPAAWGDVLSGLLTRADVEQWLTEAHQFAAADLASQRGVLFLEALLAALTPKETALLANYPNPFNPETWIPYQLAKPAEVMITIYAANGRTIRQLALGHQPAGLYQSRSRAAYWDGKNALGEPVASGVYFYTLTASDFTATRKMLIRK